MNWQKLQDNAQLRVWRKKKNKGLYKMSQTLRYRMKDGDFDRESRQCPQYWLWRRIVFTRDGFQCQGQDCGKTTDLIPHHMIPWAKNPKERFNPDNGITLCRSCHAKRHPWLKKPIKTILRKALVIETK
jgi:5-methylcytosine-specific restriction endonuclease McrA